jgi:hypothetical protein
MSNLPCILTYQNLIYGNEHLSDNENAYVFIKVQEFIIASRRFAAWASGPVLLRSWADGDGRRAKEIKQQWITN